MTDPIEHGGSHWPSEARLFIDILQRELQEQRNIVATMTAVRKELTAEVERMKHGDFTPEEIQDFCHKLTATCPRSEFEAGCKAYQDKLYGGAAC